MRSTAFIEQFLLEVAAIFYKFTGSITNRLVTSHNGRSIQAVLKNQMLILSEIRQ